MAVNTCVGHVVVDAGGFIRNAPIREIGENVYTVPEVVYESCDKTTRKRLQVLPYTLNFKQPSSEAIIFVSDFARKTGDYRNLSATDIKVLALTYMLEKEHVGIAHIKNAPDKKPAQYMITSRPLDKPTNIAGFYLSPTSQKPKILACQASENKQLDANPLENKQLDNSESENKNNYLDNDLQQIQIDTSRQYCLLAEETSQNSQKGNLAQDDVKNGQEIRVDVDNIRDQIECVLEDQSFVREKQVEQSSHPVTSLQKFAESDCGEESKGDGEILPDNLLEEDDINDDDTGWITPSNIQEVKRQMGDTGDVERVNVPVACLTTDFAMQNVLIQMGLNVVSVDGMLIKCAKSYVLRCFACMKICFNMTKVFCPHCGNKTLKRVSMMRDENGTVHYYISKRPINTHGFKFPLPLPKGGKHANNPVLVEDQPVPQQRPSQKAQKGCEVFDLDLAGSSPFAVNDVTSRAAQLGISGKHATGIKAYWNKRNPNEPKKRHGRRK